jgi:hypothetical protein
MDIRNLLGRLGAEEDRFLRQEFLAPVLRGGEVQVRIAGVICKIRVEPSDFEGWGVFQPASHTNARLSRPATLAERRAYLNLFPTVQLIVCSAEGTRCLAATASFGDQRFKLEGLAPVNLSDAVQPFDRILARYDGSKFWFDGPDTRADAATAAYLRTSFAAPLPPDELARPGLSAEERAAYELNYWKLVGPEHAKAANQPAEDAALHRLRENLSHAGAELIDYLERADSFRVTYRIGQQQYTSAVNKDDLTVQVAGICLSGEDEKFDLASLVGVLREADGNVLEVGDRGIDEEHYWRVHPRRRNR